MLAQEIWARIITESESVSPTPSAGKNYSGCQDTNDKYVCEIATHINLELVSWELCSFLKVMVLASSFVFVIKLLCVLNHMSLSNSVCAMFFCMRIISLVSVQTRNILHNRVVIETQFGRFW